MSCDYHNCKAKEEIERLVSGHKHLLGKQDRIEAHHNELLNLHTKLSGSVVTLTDKFDLQAKDREYKHQCLIDAINGIQKNLESHTEEEMTKFRDISDTFKRIEIAMIKDKADATIEASKIKLFNDKITWKVIGLASLASTLLGAIASWLWGKL